jgi:hypothetical protein
VGFFRAHKQQQNRNAKRKGWTRYFMAALVIHSLNAANGETRILLLVLLILAVVLITAGAIIAVLTFSYARRERTSLADENTLGERR